MTNKHEPLIRIEKKKEVVGNKLVLLYIVGVLAAVVVGGVFLAAIGLNPVEGYMTIINGAFRSEMAIQATVKLAIPLLISALGISFAFKMKFWNIGAEGQIIAGAIFATYFALFHDGLPHAVLLALMLAAGAVGGGLWGLIPAFFRRKFGTNETLLTLMLNYIALNFIKFFVEGPWRDPASGGYPKIAQFSQNARLDKVMGVHFGWIIALVLVAVSFVYLKYTKHGFEISVVGESEDTARYAGMNVNKIVLRTMFISAAICGIAGAVEVSGNAFTLSGGVAGGTGFTAIIVAWLARLNPVVCVLVTAFFAIIEKGCGVLQSSYGLSTAVSGILQGIILFVVLATDFFVRYKFTFGKGGKKA